MANELDEPLKVNRSCTIAPDELKWRFSASGGPGGQHANTSNTRVELIFEVATSRALGPRQRALLLERFGEVVRVVVTEERSQTRNRAIARDRLGHQLAEALRVRKVRRATRPTVASHERRLASKSSRAETKRRRRTPGIDD